MLRDFEVKVSLRAGSRATLVSISNDILLCILLAHSAGELCQAV